MSDEPKTIFARFVEQPYRFFLWLALATLLLMGLCLFVETVLPRFDLSSGMRSVAAFGSVGLVGGFIVGVFGCLLALIPPLQPLMRWMVRRSAFLLACLVTLVALFYAVENFRGKRAWENFKRTAEAKGEPLEVASIVPPPVPNEQNVAMTPLFKELCNEFDPEWRRLHSGPNGLTNDADRLKFEIGRKNDSWPKNESANWTIGRRTDLKAWQDYYRNPKPTAALETGTQRAFMERYGIAPSTVASNLPAAQTTQEFPVAPQPQTPAADVLLALSKYDVLVGELREAGTRPKSRFPIRYEDGFGALLPHMTRLRNLNHFLRLRAAAELELGRTNEAAADLELSLRLVDLVREEPLLISQLVRIAQLQLALSPLWEGLAEHRWTEQQLAGFERRLNQFDFLADYHHAMRGERALCIWTIDYLRRERNPDIIEAPADQSGDRHGGLEHAFGTILFHLIPRGWFEQNKVSIGRMHIELTMPPVNTAVRQISPSEVKSLAKTMDQQLNQRSAYNWFAAYFLPALGNAAAKFAQGQASVDLARVACALERHRLAHGQYPDTLDPLTPKFIAKLPHDVINGQSFKYRRTDDGMFVLYSVGWNETDDGGETVITKNERTLDWKQGDWVWRYPPREARAAVAN